MSGRPPQWGQASQYGAGYYQQAPGVYPQQWAGYQQHQHQHQLPAGAPPPPPPPDDPGAVPPADAAANAVRSAAAGYSQQQQQQWQQWHQQQGYGGHGGAYYGQQGGWQQPQAGWHQQGGWTQQQGAAYAQHGYDSYASTAAAPPLPPQPSPPITNTQQQPAWKAAANHMAAGAMKRDASSADAYNAVPPPSNLVQSAGNSATTAGRRTFSIRPQMPNQQRPAPPNNTLVAAFHQAAANIGTGAAASPAYTAVQLPSQHRQQQQQQQVAASQSAATGPQQWPPALKAYVERAFKTADAHQRPKLQDVLKTVIGDAQNSGELWTRDWEAMPLPDLSQTAADAAAILSEVAAVSGPAAAMAAAAGASNARSSRWAAPTPRQQYAALQHYSAQQQHAAGHRQASYGKQQPQLQKDRYAQRAQRQRLDTGEERYGGRSHKRGHRSDSSRSSDSENDGWSHAERQRRQRRAGRFNDSGSRHGTSWSAEERRQRVLAMLEEGDDEYVDWEALTIKGTCQDLDKSYFRLTSAPDPATVRPEPVLRCALERLVDLLRNGGVSYFYVLDQFKGMRQDCTVQHIRNNLAVQVYEAHARAALEYGDVAEYNQCQSQLRTLYNEGVPGCRTEFLAYRIIYQAVHAKHGENLQLLNTLKKVKPEEAVQPAVAHALRVRAALAAADYLEFFRLYAAAPALGRALMDIYVPTLRFDALNVVVKAFKPSVPVPFLAGLLGFVPAAAEQAGKSGGGGGQVSERANEPGADAGFFAGGAMPSDGQPSSSSSNGTSAAAAAPPAARGSSSGEPLPGCMPAYFAGEHAPQADMEQGCLNCIAWLADCGAEMTGSDGPPVSAALDCKASVGQLKIPEEKAKVAHGDENLRLEDFLKSFS